jgi:hypothetical protein
MLMPDWRDEVPQTLFPARRKIKLSRPGFDITRLTNRWTGARIAFLFGWAKIGCIRRARSTLALGANFNLKAPFGNRGQMSRLIRKPILSLNVTAHLTYITTKSGFGGRMADRETAAPVTIEELLISTLAQTDALAKRLGP